MAISGKVLLFTTPDNKRLVLAVKNEGNQALGVTNNYFPNEAQAKSSGAHDDTSYGHGLECMPGSDAWSFQEFPIGGSYNGHKIAPGGYLRVGLRGAAMAVAQVPTAGKSVELDLVKDFHWYSGNASSNSHSSQVSRMSGWHNASMKKNVGGNHGTIQSVLAAMAAQKAGVLVKGTARVTAHQGAGGVLSHWTVRFENEGKTPFIGTVVFKDAKKNDGIGLESMGVPNQGSAAEQRIEANGNYGITAKPKLTVRLGVRGWGFREVQLPAGGSLDVPLSSFTVDSSQVNKKFFKRDEVEKKQQEKLDKVRFFEGGEPINDALEPITYRGAEAIANAPFDPPRLTVKGVPHSDATPGGGWIIELTNQMPNADDEGPVGFVGTLKLGPTGVDPQQLPPKKFTAGGQKNQWFLPAGTQLGEYVAEAGAELNVGTRGTGWHASLELPETGKVVDSSKRKTLWGWRPDQYTRGNLAPEFLAKCKRGPDQE